MKVIFLDKDGVLNSKNYLMKEQQIRSTFSKILRTEEDKIRYEMFSVNPKCLHCLKKIILETNASVVLTNADRFNEYFQRFLEMCKIPIYGVTPYLGNKRNLEIDAYLNEHQEITDYIILDDEEKTFSEEQKLHLIQTDSYLQGNGLKEKNIEEAISYLNGMQRKKSFRPLK